MSTAKAEQVFHRCGGCVDGSGDGVPVVLLEHARVRVAEEVGDLLQRDARGREERGCGVSEFVG
jgi:hypothetical protein